MVIIKNLVLFFNRKKGDFAKVNINFQQIIMKNDKLKWNESELRKILILFNKLIKQKGRLLIDEEISKLIIENMMEFNV